jgi:hypothetical protein
MSGKASRVEVEHCGRQLRYNGATGVSDMSGIASRVEVEHCGRQLRYNGARGKRCNMDVSPQGVKLGRVESTCEMDGSEPDRHCGVGISQ